MYRRGVKEKNLSSQALSRLISGYCHLSFVCTLQDGMVAPEHQVVQD